MSPKVCRALVALPLAACTAVALAGGATPAAPASTSSVVRVLVQVDAQGTVRSAIPASPLQPTLRRLVRQTLQHSIAQPARDPAGHVVRSSFVMRLALTKTPAADGKYRIELAYQSIKTLPAGTWDWCRPRSKQPYLVNTDARATTCRQPQPGFEPAQGWDLLAANPRGPYTWVPAPPRH